MAHLLPDNQMHGSSRREGEIRSDITPLSVTTRSVTGERFTTVIEAGNHRLIADRPAVLGGSDHGPGPYSYLLAALGS